MSTQATFQPSMMSVFERAAPMPDCEMVKFLLFGACGKGRRGKEARMKEGVKVRMNTAAPVTMATFSFTDLTAMFVDSAL